LLKKTPQYSFATIERISLTFSWNPKKEHMWETDVDSGPPTAREKS